MKKLMVPCLYLQSEKAVTGFGQRNLFGDGNVETLASFYGDNGADELLVFDFSSEDSEHERAIEKIRDICLASELPVISAGNIKCIEDIKKLIYAGCAKVVLNFSKESNVELLEVVSRRFGKEKILVSISELEEFQRNKAQIEAFADGVLALDMIHEAIAEISDIPIILHTDEPAEETVTKLLLSEAVSGLSGDFVSRLETPLAVFKNKCKELGISVQTYESSIAWSEFQVNGDGLMPVIVQDYKTDEVLMFAYMNEEAFRVTLKSGKMTYWNRSGEELWTKGMTSGQVQYVKSLTLDCNQETILAKVSQVGTDCHTGSKSCFCQTLMKKNYDDTNPLKSFQDVYDRILNTKANVEGASDAEDLLSKRMDQILKKVGEECMEITIAAKNHEKEELKRGVSELLYQAMTLMVEKGLTWEDITRELARQRQGDIM